MRRLTRPCALALAILHLLAAGPAGALAQGFSDSDFDLPDREGEAIMIFDEFGDDNVVFELTLPDGTVISHSDPDSEFGNTDFFQVDSDTIVQKIVFDLMPGLFIFTVRRVRDLSGDNNIVVVTSLTITIKGTTMFFTPNMPFSRKNFSVGRLGSLAANINFAFIATPNTTGGGLPPGGGFPALDTANKALNANDQMALFLTQQAILNSSGQAIDRLLGLNPNAYQSQLLSGFFGNSHTFGQSFSALNSIDSLTPNFGRTHLGSVSLASVDPLEDSLHLVSAVPNPRGLDRHGLLSALSTINEDEDETHEEDESGALDDDGELDAGGALEDEEHEAL